MSLQGHGLGLGCKVFIDDRLVHEDSTFYNDNVIEIENLDGSDKRVIPMRSFTAGFLNRMMRYADKYTVFKAGESGEYSGHFKKKDGTSNATNLYQYDLCGNANLHNSGIQIGLDETNPVKPVTARDYQVEGQINTGISKYKMDRSEELGGVLGASFGKESSHFYIQRAFWNGTGSPISFNNAGIYLNQNARWDSVYYTADNQTALVARDTFNTVTIAPGAGKIVRYKISLTKKSDLIGFTNNFFRQWLHCFAGTGTQGTGFNDSTTLSVLNYLGSVTPTGQNPCFEGYETSGSYANQASLGGLIPSTTPYDLVSRSSDDPTLGKAVNSGLSQCKFNRIDYGSGDNKLFYFADVNINENTLDPLGTPGKCLKAWKRRFDNNGSTPILIKSLGLSSSYDNAGYLCGLINLGAGVTIPAGSSMTAEITFGIEV